MSDQTTFTLRSGREIALMELNQKLTYEGLLEGLPTVESNKRYVDYLASAQPGTVQRLLFHAPETPIKNDRPYPFGTPSSLPRVTCVARFKSREPARDKTLDYSELVGIWFQGEFAFPIDPIVEGMLHESSWEDEATDLEW